MKDPNYPFNLFIPHKCDQSVPYTIQVIRSVKLSKDLHGSDTRSSFETSRLYSNLFITYLISTLFDSVSALHEANEKQMARRKLAL